MSGPLIVGYEDSAEGRDAVALGGELARALGAPPLLAQVVSLPKGVLSEPELESALKAVSASELGEPAERLAALEPETEALASSSAARAGRPALPAEADAGDGLRAVVTGRDR